MRAIRIVALATGLAVSRQAAAQIPVSLDLGTGPSFQFGHLKANTATPGFDALVGLHYTAPFVPISVRLEGLYDEYDHTSSYLGARQIWAISANAIWSFPSLSGLPVVPYLLGGGGYYHTNENVRVKAASGPSPTVPTLTGSHFGLDGGAGARYRLFGVGPGIGIGIFAEARYLYYFGVHANAAMVPLVIGITFPTAVTPGA
jgi:Outer membrane protein beta-barrel domain